MDFPDRANVVADKIVAAATHLEAEARSLRNQAARLREAGANPVGAVDVAAELASDAVAAAMTVLEGIEETAHATALTLEHFDLPEFQRIAQ